MPRSALVWALGLVIAGSVAVAVCVLTAPKIAPDAPRDFFDSPYLLLAFAGLGVLAGLAGWFVPRTGILWGLLAVAPFFVYFAITIIRDLGEDDQGLWPVGVVFLVALTLIPAAAALTTSLIHKAR
ncbi:hypothetical protein [Planotetraspora mira]|jgi:hypothetical protein|uniref:Uncharacterized protein n=1 Tax=Planotetraspora mira TaxID=58121 RepID=A0A8J3TWJ5_9ACTN|nr:hypothetical protein [Planotetraspora mira]GII33572.1 hypothetical protein Pmi06nite_70140 [Planotetraspora mira]